MHELFPWLPGIELWFISQPTDFELQCASFVEVTCVLEDCLDHELLIIVSRNLLRVDAGLIKEERVYPVDIHSKLFLVDQVLESVSTVYVM